MDKEETRPGKDGSKQEPARPLLSCDPADGKRKYVRGMGAETCREALRRMLGPKSKPGRASDYMQDAHDFTRQHPDTEVYVIVRESARNQQYRRNHHNYAFMETVCRELGICVCDSIQVTGSGTDTYLDETKLRLRHPSPPSGPDEGEEARLWPVVGRRC
jgi:hypothetical protein